MHRLARRAGYPSDSSRADRQQPRARPAGGGPPLYYYAGDLLRHLRHRPGRPAAGRCHPCARPWAGPGEKPPSPHPAADVGPGAVHHRHRSRAAGAGPGAVPRRGLLSLERGPASVTAPGRRSAPGPVPSRAAARPGGPVASNCAARGGSSGLHSGLRTGRAAGLLSRPRAGRREHGCHVAGAVPGRWRLGVIAAVDRARRGSAGPPGSGVRAGARTVTQVKFAARATGHGSGGPAGGPIRPQSAGSLPTPSPGRGPCQSSRRWGTDGPAARSLSGPGRVPRQSGRRWGTDGPAASTSRSYRARGPGPDDSDYATAGPAGRALRADGAGAAGGRSGAGGPAPPLGP